MKKMLNDLKRGLTIGFGIMLMIGIIGGTYASLASLKVSSGATLTAQLRNDLVDHSVPSGFVGSFNLATCPTGWTAADGANDTPDLRGAFVRGMNGSVNGRDVVRVLGNYQADEIVSHRHSSTFHHKPAGVQYNEAYYMGGVDGSSNISWDLVYTSYVGGTETRPKNVALLYCVKN